MFSVVIPTYDRAALLRDAIEGVLEQDSPDLQLIVVDDGSTDRTREVVAGYGDRIEYLFQPNSGAAAARNRGLALARGEYIAFLDSDDVWLPGKLESELRLFERFPKAEAIISDSEHWRDGSLAIRSRFAQLGVRTSSGAPELLPKLAAVWLDRSLVSTCCLSLRRSALFKVGAQPFDTALAAFEDWEFEIRLYHACEVVVNPFVVAKVRRFEDHTRRGRSLPGTPLNAEQTRNALLHHSRILRGTLRLSGLDQDIITRIEARLHEIHAALANPYTMLRP